MYARLGFIGRTTIHVPLTFCIYNLPSRERSMSSRCIRTIGPMLS